MQRGQEFAELVHHVLTSDDRHHVKTVAQKMGMTYETLYSRIRNRTCFSAEEIRLLLRSAPDPRFSSFLLDGTDFIAAERFPSSDAAKEHSVYTAAHRVVFRAADVLQAIELALQDNRIDRGEAARIESEIEAAERVLMGLRECLRPR